MNGFKVEPKKTTSILDQIQNNNKFLLRSLPMSKKVVFTVDDFIIFLKSKILIISICTLSLATITILLQNNYTDNWDVKVSRTINKDSVLESISIINQKKTIQARKFDIIPNRVRPIEVLRDIESLIDASLVNYLTNEDISYTEIMD